MLFGNRARFGIESEVDSDNNKWLFGRVCMWMSGQTVGDYSQDVVLNVTQAFFQDFLKNIGGRVDPELEYLPASMVVSRLNEALFGDGAHTLQEALNLGKRYHKFCVSPGGGEAFDGWLVFLIEGKTCTRLIWKNSNEEKVGEIELTPGEFENILQAFVAWIDELLSGEHRK